MRGADVMLNSCSRRGLVESANSSSSAFSSLKCLHEARAMAAYTFSNQEIDIDSRCRANPLRCVSNHGLEPASRQFRAQLQQRSLQKYIAHTKINDQAGHIDQRGNEWRGGGCRIEAGATQDERQHRARQRAPHDDAD